MMTLGKISRIGRREEQSRNRLWTMLDRYNPIAGLSLIEAQQIYDGARSGDYYRIQYIYQEIERTDPTLLTCVERRVSAISGLGWRVSPSSGDIDSELADEQRDALTGYFRDLVNLPECVEHLALAFFRGYAHAVLHGNEFDLLPSWAIGRDMETREWLWRPQGRGGESVPLGSDGVVSVVHDRPIDYPALSIYIRSALAEKDWGRFIERYGLPPCILISPPDATPEQAEEFRRAAEAAADGLSMSLPSGSQVSFAAEARGVNPFLEFVQHQQKQVVLLATGGTLTSLAESGSGTLAGNAQMDVWREIVRRDSEIIGNALHRSIAIPYLRRVFPGQPVSAEFSLGRDAEPTPTEMFELAAKAVAAGYRISRDELSESTGYTLEDAKPSQPENGGFGGFAANTDAGRAENRCKTVAKPLQNARSDSDGEITAQNPQSPQSADFGVLAEAALQRDLEPVLADLSDLSNLPEEEARRRAREILDRLEDFQPSASSLSGVMELAMADGVVPKAGDKSAEACRATGGHRMVINAENGNHGKQLEIVQILFEGDEGYDDYPIPSLNSDEDDCRAENPSECPYHGTESSGTDEKADVTKATQSKEEKSNIHPGKSEREKHQEFDKNIADLAKNPVSITVVEADAILSYGVMVEDGSGNSVIFGKHLKRHIEGLDTGKQRSLNEVKRRKTGLLFYVNAVQNSKPVKNTHKNAYPNSVVYYHQKMKIIANKKDEGKYDVFDAI